MDVTFTLSFDIDKTVDKEFLEWYSKDDNKYLVKDSLLLGSFVVRNGLHKIFINEQKEGVVSRYEAEINSLNEIISHTIQSCEERVASVKEQKDALYGEQIDMLKERLNALKEGNVEQIQNQRDLVAREYMGKIEVMKQQIMELKGELDGYRETDYEKIRLQESLKQKESEIAILKSNNIVKGNIGEELVRNIISKWFCDVEVLDMSGSGSMSDIHLVDSGERRLVVECKNKASIALTDVEKSMRDIESLKETYGDKFVGYIFCSIRSYNIPRKGEFCFELIGEVPVVWFGVDFEHERELAEKELVNVVKIMMSLAKNMGTRDGIDRENFIEKMMSVMNGIGEHKKTIGLINNNLTCMKSHVDKLSLSTNDMYEDLKSMLGLNRGHTCRKCKKEFKTVGGYERHIKVCKN